ncbi:tRNA (cytidine(34)-2'-O)-methyltransferase [Thioalkalivibrio sulfidiphilus]|uniref:tRNA (cytidine(34)-2'-O)-methyltransferase n=1 Tax=Thioalkalivibrio sulfidiphilus TaxID=1033854 RepID=UPI0003616AD8|nr:tRNA (cytidine(34)-2'-O)-methyltransferase [Thioalkalivibrio sulfidiphilus]
MFHVVLYQPEIAPNTGNIMRLCANTGCRLHLIHPLGFSLDEAKLKRAGLDYRDMAQVAEYDSLAAFASAVAPERMFALTTRASLPHSAPAFRPGDAFLFGPETRGLPAEILDGLPEDRRLRIPMAPGSRSLNLSNAAAVMVYEAWRQCGFAALKLEV